MLLTTPSTPQRWEPWNSRLKKHRHRRRQAPIGGLLTPDRIGDHLVARCMALEDFRARNLSNKWLPEALGGPTMSFGSRHVLQGIVNAVDDQIQAIITYETESNSLIQLVQTGHILQQIKRLDRLLDAAFAAYGISEPHGMVRWHSLLQQERQDRMKRFQALTANKMLLTDALGDEQRQLELLTLLVHDFQKHGEDVYTKLEYEVISTAYEVCTGLSGLAVVTIPEWFVPVYEVRQRRWQGSRVDVEKLIHGTEEMCIRQAASWWDLHHPHVMKLFGACHVGNSLALVRESAQCVKECNSTLPAQDVLVGTAHVLEFLHERHVMPGTLSLERMFSAGKESKVMLHGGDLLEAPEGFSLLDATKQTIKKDTWGSSDQFCIDTNTSSDMISVVNQLSKPCKPARWHFWNRKSRRKADDLPRIVMYSQSYMDPILKTSAKSLFEEIGGILDRDKTEGTSMDTYVCERLANVHQQLLGSPYPQEVIHSLFDILTRFKWSLTRRADSIASSFCVASSRSVEHSSLSFHGEIDALMVRCGLAKAGVVSLHDWKPYCDRLRRNHQESFQSALDDLVDGLDGEEERIEAATLLFFEATKHRSSFDRNQLRAIEHTATSIAGRHGNGDRIIVPKWFIPRYEIVVGGQISAGSFGAVHHGKWLNATVAVKCLFQGDRKLFMREANIWFTLNHPNVVKLYGACHVGKTAAARSLDEPVNHTDRRPFFVCEYASEGTLTEYLRRWQVAHKSRSDVWRCLCEAAQGLQYLHERGIIHGDLKGNNILVGSDRQVKLTDFGLSAFSKKLKWTGSTETIGAVRWKAPERLGKLDRGPSFASDIYSFGMCIIEAVIGTFPWCETMDEDVVISKVTQGQFPPRPAKFSDEQWGLVSSMCCLNPADRINISAVVALLGSLK